MKDEIRFNVEIQRNGFVSDLTDDELLEAHVAYEKNLLLDYILDYENLRYKNTNKYPDDSELRNIVDKIYELRNYKWDKIEDLGALECEAIDEVLAKEGIIYD